MSDEINILRKSEAFASNILQNEISNELTYHNFSHTKQVVEGVKIIGEVCELSQEDLETLLIAAWFHDTGFRDIYENHEDRSQEIATEFLRRENISEERVELVCACIAATKPDQSPKNKLEEVLCDADLCHVAKSNYLQVSENLRKEWSNVLNKQYTDIDWYKMNIDFMASHKFYTKCGQEVLNKTKEENKAKLQKNYKKLQRKLDMGLEMELGVTPEELKALKKKLTKVEGKPERGIETMFRLTSKNHLSLSAMADSKANIMISVNSIIISILIGALMQKLDSNPHLIIPTFLLLTVNLGSIITSILSTRPNITKGKFTRDDIENHRTNLLFFGNFHSMKREDYHWGMNQLMDNSNYLYSSLIDDIYFLGIVLGKKYKHLRLSYNIFMYGIVISVIAFILANIYNYYYPSSGLIEAF